jgi:hypothetical protein
MHRGRLLVALLIPVLLSFVVACGGDGLKGAPTKNGEYAVKPGSVSYDGDRYRLLWEDSNGQFKELSGKGLKMIKDEQTKLIRDKDGTVLHLREDEPVQVLGRDSGGNYSSPWFPFFLGAAVGNTFSRPSYHYPPTDTFGRGDQLNGSVVQSKPQAPKYEGLPANPNAVSGQNQGTGGGNAVTNKAGGGASGQTTGGATVSGQAAGTGSGSAASTKGGFQKGTNSFESRAGKTSSGGSGVSSGSGSNSGQKAAPKNSKPSAPKPKAPSRGGGRSGGK